jgi:two-component system sensor histidine kinase MtrB
VVAGVSAGGLALGAAIVVTSYRSTTFTARAHERVQHDLRLLNGGTSPDLVAGRLADAEQPGGPVVVLVAAGGVSTSAESIQIDDVPPRLRRDVRAHPGELADARVQLPTGATLVVGGLDAPSQSEAYFFFPREDLERSIRELEITLAIGWIVVLGVAAVAGTMISRRTLRPVRSAADAARSVAEGLLETRLPVGSSDEFGEWALAFNEMVDALDQKISALAEARDREQRFSADIAHELRTPIGAVLTTASHLASDLDAPPDQLREMADIILNAGRRLDRLTSELLELHRLESGSESLQIEPVDVRSAIDAAVRAHGWSDAVCVCGAPSLVIDTDRRRLDRIVVNLVANGIAHGGGDVTVDVRHERDGAVFSVSDRGPGIADEALRRLFDRHFKASRHRTSVTNAGSGLGLSIAQESAHLLGGHIVAESVEGAGATFTVWLPLA